MKRVSRLNRILAILQAVILTCLFLFASASAETGSGEVLTVGVPADRCPVFYRDAESGYITGIGVDLMRFAAEKAGYTVSFRVIEEETLPQALDSDSYDLVLPFGSAVRSASGRPTVVSDNLIRTPFTLVTKSGGYLPPWNSLHVGMLASLKGGAETVRELYPGIKIVLYNSIEEAVQALRKGEVDALLHNSYVWSYVLQKPAYSDLSVQPSAMLSMDFRAGAPDTPAGREMMDRLNGGIAEITDTFRQAIVLDFTTRRLYRYDLSDYLSEYGLIILLCVCLIVAVILIVIEKQRTMKLEQEEKMRQLIDQDSLTGLLSLEGFLKQAENMLRNHPEQPYVLVYANIRNFKYINDNLGKDRGDDLLRFWAEKSREALSDGDIICRIAADHFAVLSRAEGEAKLERYDQHVIDAVRSYFTDRGREVRVQICGGIYVLTPDDYKDINIYRMLDYARMAEKKVRETRRDGYEFYNPEQWDKGKQVAEIINHLPAAIRDGNIHVWYQPQVNGETGEIIGAEALCRWDHDKLGWLYPPEFIESLEESGMIYDLDCYVWNRVCEDLHRWNEQGIHRSVSVNVSRCDLLKNRDLPGHFRDLVKAHDLTPDQLRIEITETAFVENPADLISLTGKLQEYGFEVEMDDFGSGYSSLHMLKEVPVNRIKLDLHFLTESGDSVRGRTIISYMIRMVRDLGMKMITEGVETEEQARFLRSKGCSEMQGFWFYKPMPVEDFEKAGTTER